MRENLTPVKKLSAKLINLGRIAANLLKIKLKDWMRTVFLFLSLLAEIQRGVIGKSDEFLPVLLLMFCLIRCHPLRSRFASSGAESELIVY